MKILVTGGTGHVGKSVAARLVAEGCRVRIIDANPQPIDFEAEVVACDITNFEALRAQMDGIDAVVHLAAIPSPGIKVAEDVFRINCTGSFNLYEAASLAGIRRVVSASSINALGSTYGLHPVPVQYLPIDEDHPGNTTDVYAFSKHILEDIAAYYCRRAGISGVCFRMPGIYRATPQMRQERAELRKRFRHLFEKVLAMPPGERKTWLDESRQRHHARRSLRLLEVHRQGEKPAPPPVDPEDPFNLLLWGYTEFWTVLSVEDAAEAYWQALKAEYTGSHTLFITESRNTLGIEAESLAAVFYPEVTHRTRPMPGDCSLISCDRARQIIGFDPKNSIHQF